MGKELESERACDFGNKLFSENDLFQEVCFLDRCRSCARESVVDEELKRIFPIHVGGILDLGDDFGDKLATINGFWVQAIFFAFCDFLKIFLVEAHFLGDGLKL